MPPAWTPIWPNPCRSTGCGRSWSAGSRSPAPAVPACSADAARLGPRHRPGGPGRLARRRHGSIDALLVKFRDSAAEAERVIDAAYRSGDLAELAAAAHRLKGAAQAVGAHGVGQHCRRARAGRQGRRQGRLPQQSRSADRGTSPGAKRDPGVNPVGAGERRCSPQFAPGPIAKGRGKAPALLLAVLGVAYRSTTSCDSIRTGRAMLK